MILNNRFVNENKMQYITKEDNDLFRFLDGPPFVSSETLHYGHILVSSVKSAILHYKYMNGFNIQNTIGYDCHGLPIEMKINDMLGLKTMEDVAKYGIKEYNDKCKEFIDKCQSSWTPIYKGIGRVVDDNNYYRTVDEDFMRTVWKVFKELWDKDFVTRGKRIVPYSVACGTSLSNFEASQNYKEVTDTSLYWRFKILNADNEYVVIWTTTPWTIPANQAVCMGSKIEYSLLQFNDGNYWIATDRVEAFKSITKRQGQVINKKFGTDFTSNKYIGFDGFEKSILNDDYVTTDSGTGIVHIAPEFGEDDLRVAIVNNLDITFGYINDNGIIQRGPFKGEFVFNTIRLVIIMGNENKDLLAKESYKHTYPYCWRTDTPLIYRAMNSLFISVSKIKERLVEFNKNVNWIPSYVGDKRFNDWLMNARDWGISRNRVFGTPIPVWVSDDDDCICVDESEITGDLHRDNIDNITIERNGKVYKRIPDVFDCWFESGCVPFVVGNKAADLIVEGIDQTRGWFYTLMVLWVALRDESPYKSVVTCGLILAEDGKKMSKRLNNYKDVNELLKQYGPDAIRLYLLNSSATQGEAFKFVEKDMIKIIHRLTPYKNAVVFWKQFGKNRRDNQVDINAEHLDRWIQFELYRLSVEVKSAMSYYLVKDAVNYILSFVDKLCNKYVRFMRDNIRENGSGVLWNVLQTFTLILTPFAPFMAEEMYKELNFEGESIHPIQESYPDLRPIFYDNTSINTTMDLIEVVRQLRDKAKVSIKKPIAQVNLNIDEIKNDDLLQLFIKETNVMNITWNAKDVSIDTTENPEIINAYKLRLVNRLVCNLRKELGLVQSDYVEFRVKGDKFLNFIDNNREFFDKLFPIYYIDSDTKILGSCHITIDGIEDGEVFIYR